MLELNSDTILYISKIDGDRFRSNIKNLIELTPGIHTLVLDFRTSWLKGLTKNHQEFDLSFDAKADRRYKVEFNANKDYSKWSVYIMDTAEKRRVSTLASDAD